jgi:biotin synthase-related radical SAM superfamily protein
MKIERAKELMQLEGDDLESLFDEARAVKEKLCGKNVNFYFTGRSFPAISVTGSACALNCKHCGRSMLDGVHHARKGSEVVEMAKAFEEKGATGCLITGGCRPDGSVPIDEHLEAIETIKKETSLFLLAHTGIIDLPAAKALKGAGLDGVSLDIVGNSATAEKVYGVEIGPERYRDSLIAFEKAGFNVISPHVCVGLDFGEVSHELEALGIVSSIRPTTIEIIALMPLRGTPMENSKPDPMDVAKIIAIAQLWFPKTPITLGCAHSKGTDRAKIEELALRAGASSIALPTPKTEKLALKMGYDIKKIETCCALPPRREAKKMSKIRVSVGTASQLGLKPCKNSVKMETAYLLTYYDGRCSANCQFCAQARGSSASLDRVARGVYPEYPLEDTISSLKDAVETGEIKRACIQTINRPELMEDLASLIERLSKTGTQISLSMHPASYEELEYLKGLGAQRIIIPLDAVTEELFDRIKGKSVNNPYRWEEHWAGFERALKVFGNGRVGTHIILGFGETERDALNTIDCLLKMGVGVGLFAFVPIKGTPLGHVSRPPVESYRRVQLGYYLLRKKLANLSDFEFNGGKLLNFGIPKERLVKVVETGGPFLAAGCPNCNRPYSTEGPLGPIYNYASPPSKRDIEEIKLQMGF